MNHSEVEPKGYVYRTRAAEILGVSVTTLWRMTHADLITVHRTGAGVPCYRVADLKTARAAREQVT